MRLILASASPRRAELLRAAGFEFEILAVDVDETVRPGEAPDVYVRRLAMEKSARALQVIEDKGPAAGPAKGPAKAGPHVREVDTADSVEYVGSGFSRTDVVVLAADTAVVVDGDILGKPLDDRHAAEMLRRLSGRWHDVLTGVSLRSQAIHGVRLPWPERSRRQPDLAREVGCVERTAVEFSPLSEADVTACVASGEWRDKAGAYAIQGRASRFIPRIEGSYSSVVGLPVAAVEGLLARIASAGHSGYSQR